MCLPSLPEREGREGRRYHGRERRRYREKREDVIEREEKTL